MERTKWLIHLSIFALSAILTEGLSRLKHTKLKKQTKQYSANVLSDYLDTGLSL